MTPQNRTMNNDQHILLGIVDLCVDEAGKNWFNFGRMMHEYMNESSIINPVKEQNTGDQTHMQTSVKIRCLWAIFLAFLNAYDSVLR